MVEPEGEMQLQSPLAILLLHKFAWGRLAASEVQQFADTAVKSGATGDDLLNPAEAGWPWVQQKQLPQRLGKSLFQKYAGTTACGGRNLGEGEKFSGCCSRRKQKSACHFTA